MCWARPPVVFPADRFVVLDGVRFHHLDWGGDGEPLLLLAGLGCTAHVFAELAPHLTDRFRVLALTRRGHGLTEPTEGGHTIADGAEDALRLLDALGIGRAHVVGHSMGAGEASTLAARHPGRVARVVLLDGAYDWADRPGADPEPAEEGPDRFASYEEYADFVHSLFPDDLRGPAFDAMLRTSVRTEPDGSVVDKHSDAALAPFVRDMRAFRHPYAEIAAPVLAVYAVADGLDADEAAWRTASRRRFAEGASHGQVAELRGSHYLFIDRRADVLAVLRGFLRR